MPVITINGPVGSGPIEVGQMVGQLLNINYVDRLVFAEAAKLVGSPVGALIEKEQRVVRFRDKLGRFLQTMLERSAVAGVSGEPYFGRGIEMLPAETYIELAGDPSSLTQRVNDNAFIEATTSVVTDLAKAGDVVIIGRGANIMLADLPGVVHIGMWAPLDVRVQTAMNREHFSQQEAEKYVEELEQARVTFFRKFFKVNPYDPSLYHIMLNMGMMQPRIAAEVITHTVDQLGY
jgi:cytidylate kinase